MKTILFPTSLGHVALVGQGEILQSLSFGHSSAAAAKRAVLSKIKDFDSCLEVTSHPDFLQDLQRRLVRFAEGEPIDFSDVSVETSHLTEFGQRVILACRELSWGETATYGELAHAAGRPAAARAVGSVMASNRVPLVVPCHRVVAASGRLGGFSAPQGVAMKRRLLALEQQAAYC